MAPKQRRKKDEGENGVKGKEREKGRQGERNGGLKR
jgi:hypothetical protein